MLFLQALVAVAAEPLVEAIFFGVHVLEGAELVEVVYFALVAHDGLVVFVNCGVKVGEGLL